MNADELDYRADLAAEFVAAQDAANAAGWDMPGQPADGICVRLPLLPDRVILETRSGEYLKTWYPPK